MRPFFFNIDVIGACNLACISCPQGNETLRLSKGLMSPDLLKEILQKATSECYVFGVGLFNWTEPLLHPDLPKLIEIVKSFGLKCYISSNLNREKGIREMLAAEPYSLRISCSGFNQKNYGITHTKGDIEAVKRNMKLVSELKSSKTKVHMLFHRYVMNWEDEILMKEYCEQLNIKFIPIYAYLMPLEKVLSRWEGIAEREPVEQYLHTSLDQAKQLCSRKTDYECRMQIQEITLNHLGEVHLCCAVYDPKRFRIGKYLDMSIDDIQNFKMSSLECSNCIKRGGHVYAMGLSNTIIFKFERNLKSWFVKNGYKYFPRAILSKIL